MPRAEAMASPVRLDLQKKGTVLLKKSRMPAIDCPLTALTTGECCCRLNWESMDSSAVRPWKMMLLAGLKLEIDLTAPPYVYGMTLSGKVVFVSRVDMDLVDVTIKFVDLTGEQAKLIQRTVCVLGDQGPALKEAQRYKSHNKTNPKMLRTSKLKLLAEKCRNKPFEELVISFGKTNHAQMRDAHDFAQRFDQSLDRSLWRMGFLNPVDLCRIWALQSGLPMARSGSVMLPSFPPKNLDYSLMRLLECVPYKETETDWKVAVARPPTDDAVMTLAAKLAKLPRFYLIPIDELEAILLQAATHNHFSRRRKPRYRTSLPLVFQLCDDLGATTTQSLTVGETLDISEGGMAVSGGPARERMPEDLLCANAWCRVSFFCPPDEINALCKICHIQRGPTEKSPDRWVYGLQFMQLSDFHRGRLMQICEDLAREGKMC